MAQFQSFWKIVSPQTRKQLYTTLSTDAYDPRGTDLSSMAAVTWYSQIMRGPGSRIASYKQYDAMDADIDISRSLDIIAEEMSGKDAKTDLPFIIDWQKEDNQDVSDMTVVTVRAALRQWSQIQDLKRRVFMTSRKLVMYGDCFFRKSSDTSKWAYVDPTNVVGIEVDEIGNKVAYHLKRPGQGGLAGPMGAGGGNAVGSNRNEMLDIVPAAAMIHFSMSDDMGDSAPFGSSVLKPIFRVYRQLSMLEDATIIYRIVRAPERRVFYIDVGNMNQQQVKRYLESVKTEIRQKRVSGSSTSGKDSVDGALDPTSLQEDYFFPVTAGGKGSRVETLPGGSEDFGVTLLRAFQEKIFRGLRIPTSYLGGGDGTGAQTNDGKVGIAYIEELRFAQFIGRLQDRVNEVYDQEFKIYMKVCGLMVDDEVFSIRLPDPANFALYRQAALDADLINSFGAIEGNNYLARRFILKRYLGLSDDEIQMNEVMLKEERNMTDNAAVPIMQQMYDPAVYGNRAPILVGGGDAMATGGGTDEFSTDPTAGLLGDTPEAGAEVDADGNDIAASSIPNYGPDEPLNVPAATPAPAPTAG